jgi:RHS repeat-associated protein
VNITYIIGRNRISQITLKNNTEQELYFTFDGHGSTRVLTDFAGAILELYAFDAYGNAIGFDPSVALTEFLYSGEQFDSKIGQQYLRARYYDPATGRFNRLDPFFGNLNDPLSLHKYFYVYDDPINGFDPSGQVAFIPVLLTAMAIGAIIGGGIGTYKYGFGTTDMLATTIAYSLSSAVLATGAYALYSAITILGLNNFTAISMFLGTFGTLHGFLIYYDSQWTKNYLKAEKDLLSLVKKPENKTKLQWVFTVAWFAGFTVFPSHQEHCHRWENAVRDAIYYLLGEDVYNNEEFKITYVLWDMSDISSEFVDHGGLRIEFPNHPGKYGYLDDVKFVFTDKTKPWGDDQDTESIAIRKPDPPPLDLKGIWNYYWERLTYLREWLGH